MKMHIEMPKRDDDAEARRWRGALFEDFHSPIMWKGKYYEMLEPPSSVTFPICQLCQHIIWEWPHFEESVPENAICEACFKAEEEAQRRDDEAQW